MNEFRATLAIVRRHVDRRFGADFIVQFVLLCGIGYAFAHTFGSGFIPIGIAACLASAGAAERSHAANLRRVSFFAMPLFGRQLARAHAVAPSVLGLAAPLGYAAGAALRHAALPRTTVAAMLLASLVATLVSLSSVFRDGVRAWLYVALAAVVATAATALPLALAHRHAFALAACGCAIAAFFALRAFGETLARYDPLPS